jgi:predicted ATP-grasp superfamily ATP-dependent carboligase
MQKAFAMNYYYILHKTSKVPAGGRCLKFAKEITLTNVQFTSNRTCAKKMRLAAAIIYALVHGLSTAPCKQVDDTTIIKKQTADCTGGHVQTSIN